MGCALDGLAPLLYMYIFLYKQVKSYVTCRCQSLPKKEFFRCQISLLLCFLFLFICNHLLEVQFVLCSHFHTSGLCFRLKPSIDFQYSLNAKVSSPAELVGLRYKTELKPAVKAYAVENKRISTSNLDESVDLQKQSQENVKILDEKKNNIISLQAKTDEVSSSIVIHHKYYTLHFTVQLFPSVLERTWLCYVLYMG
jgi:hypothetical protein